MTLIHDLGMQFANNESKRAYRYGIYMCEICGKEFKKRTANIKYNSYCVSCSSSIRFTKHGGKKDRLYSVWISMKQRCYNNNHKSFKNYGNRGISVCSEWLKDYINFKDWSLSNGYSENLTIDRINNDGNYEPSNCRWSNKAIQMQNTRLIHSTNISGYRGVHYSNYAKKWRASIQHNKMFSHLGYFNSKEEASIAYDEYVIKNNLEHPLNKEKKC